MIITVRTADIKSGKKKILTGTETNLNPETVDSIGPGKVKGTAIINIGTIALEVLAKSPESLAAEIGKARGWECLINDGRDAGDLPPWEDDPEEETGPAEVEGDPGPVEELEPADAEERGQNLSPEEEAAAHERGQNLSPE